MPGLVQIRPRPSSAHQWGGGGCTGSPEWKAAHARESGAAATEGNRLHELAADFLNPGEAKCAVKDWKIIAPYVFDVRQALAAAKQRGPAVLNVEVKATWKLDALLEGTPDAALFDYTLKHLTIWDLKTGWGLVEVDGNWQLMTYAMMLLSHLADADEWTVELRIVQPRPWHPRGTVRAWTPSKAQRAWWFKQIADKFGECMTGPKKLKTGSHCRYCDAITVCPSARALSMHVVDWSTREPHDLPVEHLAGELAQLRQAAAMLKNRIAGVEATITANLQKGVAVPYATVERGGARTVWVDEAKARSALQFLTGVDHATPKLPTPRQLIDAGVSKSLVATLTKTNPGKAVVAIDLDGSKLKQMLGDLPTQESKTQ